MKGRGVYLQHITLVVTLFILSNTLQAQRGSMGKSPNKKARESYMNSGHFDGKRFQNEIPTGTLTESIGQILKEKKESKNTPIVPSKTIPVLPIDTNEFKTVSADVNYWWLGHSSILMEIENKRILIDPVFSKRVAPAQWFGPKRTHPTPIELEDLPKIDVVLISHDHYDHLDFTTVKYLKKEDIIWMVPLGVGSHLKKWGVDPSRIKEFNWWDEMKIDNLTFAATPARHFSGRGIFDRSKTFWASWTILSPTQKVFYSGDTGYGPHFKAIQEKYGSFDLAFIQIGAYSKNWPDIHMYPEEGLQTMKDLKSNVIFPVHWCSFNLALHTWAEPIERLYKGNTDNLKIVLPKVGEKMNLDSSTPHKWWDEVK